MKKEEVVIFGAGLVGSLLSIYLVKAGFKVTVYEKRSDPRKSNQYAGRSINLALSVRGIRALQAVGLGDDLESMVIPMKGRRMHDLEGNLTFQPYGKDGQFINSISRGGLNERLVTKAESLGVDVLFDHRCSEVDLEATRATIENNGKTFSIEADVMFGADGAFSAMRQSFLRQDRFNYQQYYIEHGYKELSIPPTKDGDFAIAPDGLHIWPRGNFMLIALPNLDKSFTVTLFFPFEGEPSFDSVNGEEGVKQFFEEYFPDTLELIPDLTEQFLTNPTSSLVTVKCYPWNKGKCLMLGDAGHAIVPFYGQGMNSGFEDCYLFDEMAKAHNYNWDTVLDLFQQSRKKDADAIADLALKNFVEMRDHVADERFLVQKKVEARLHDLYPNEWIPQYSMVTFSHTPYLEAWERGNLQNRVIQPFLTEEVLKNPEVVDCEKVMEALRSVL